MLCSKCLLKRRVATILSLRVATSLQIQIWFFCIELQSLLFDCQDLKQRLKLVVSYSDCNSVQNRHIVHFKLYLLWLDGVFYDNWPLSFLFPWTFRISWFPGDRDQRWRRCRRSRGRSTTWRRTKIRLKNANLQNLFEFVNFYALNDILNDNKAFHYL